MPHRKVVPERGFPYSQGGIVDIESRLISLSGVIHPYPQSFASPSHRSRSISVKPPL